ncbi:hypothetical protein TanjilG_26194 [Lupinus angustifolius]|uniref:Pseudouridine synthase I TruA alpha/beta domain-containing protein n=2 Tax=Lupinus angustifolius TaxID=3871 RepID=A0A4P1R2A7_LUPAN|nr:PREDICTED: tRNA pseudouridine synthase A, mitochondrial-like isoform X1 [Lupinus angustifolius]XP_019464720.1 PREDICTED: tRNA pseudouridine synthase A, mitochondrial-like isoform X1 [Lupinus angustifolius]OIV99856.1 hypothetical protein TanjilG_26194 [Lupinus angustifolius]
MENTDTKLTSSSPRLPPPPISAEEAEPKKLKMSTTTSDDEECTTATGTKIRYKRRKIAIFFAYCGVGYQGMQKNPGAKTIEGDLEEALYASGAVPEHDRGIPKQYDFARSARTDKGVSAVGQVVSGRFYIDPPGLVDRLNSILSPQIRIFGYKRVTGSYHAKKFCDRRRYVYLLPVFALDPFCHRDREAVMASLGSDSEFVKCFECSERGRKVVGLFGNGKRNMEVKVLDVEAGISSNRNDSLNFEVTEGAEVSLSKGDSINLNEESSDEAKVLVDNVISKTDLETVAPLHEELAGNGKHSMDVEAVYVEAGIASNKNAALNSEVTEEVEVSPSKGDCDILTKESGNEAKVLVDSVNSKTDLETVVSAQDEGTPINGGPVYNSTILEEDKVNGEDRATKGREFCYGEKERERFNRILNYYVGTHNFHNFTTRTKAEDPAAKRFIISFDASTVVFVDGIEFVKCEVVGQSFMLHQIRKMMGLAVAIMRNCAPESLINKALQQDVSINVPTAPEAGLYLDECFFTSYNQKWEDSHEELSMKDYEKEAEEFKMKYIYSHIASTEHKYGNLAIWLHSLNHRNYPDLRVFDEEAITDNKEAQVVQL